MNARLPQTTSSAARRGSAKQTVARVSERVRRRRMELGLTLKQVAEAAGVSVATVQKVESRRLVPSVAVFVKIAKGLRLRASYLLDDEEDEASDLRLVRKTERRLLPVTSKLQIESIADGLRDSRIQACLITIPPGVDSGESLDYRGEVLFFCMRGRVSFDVRGEAEVLRSGDAFHLKADIPHRWRNASSRPAQLLVVWSGV